MEAIEVNQRLRPIRYGFMISPNDKNAALTAASFNTVLWGGIFNPIILTEPRDQLVGSLKAFDPDFLVKLGACEIPTDVEELFEDRVILESDLTRDKTEKGRRIKIGFSIVPVLWEINEKDLSSGSKPSRAAVMTGILEEWILYTSFSYGGFVRVPDLTFDLIAAFKDVLRATEITFSTEEHNYNEYTFPIHTTSYGLRCFGGFGSFSSHVICIGDHDNLGDLINFWNIRATGRHVYFVPVANYRSHRAAIERIIKGGQYRMAQEYENYADLLKSPSVVSH